MLALTDAELIRKSTRSFWFRFGLAASSFADPGMADEGSGATIRVQRAAVNLCFAMRKQLVPLRSVHSLPEIVPITSSPFAVKPSRTPELFNHQMELHWLAGIGEKDLAAGCVVRPTEVKLAIPVR